MILVNIIRIFHLLIILFILGAPFYDRKKLHYAIFLLIYIIYKWKIDGSCGLTKLEYYLLGKKSEHEGFIYRLINPLKILEKDFNKYLEKFTYIWLILLLFIYYNFFSI